MAVDLAVRPRGTTGRWTTVDGLYPRRVPEPCGSQVPVTEGRKDARDTPVKGVSGMVEVGTDWGSTLTRVAKGRGVSDGTCPRMCG